MKGLQREFSDIQNHCTVPIPTSSMTIPSMSRIDLTLQRRQKDEQKCFLGTARKPLRWGRILLCDRKQSCEEVKPYVQQNSRNIEFRALTIFYHWMIETYLSLQKPGNSFQVIFLFSLYSEPKSAYNASSS